MSKNALWNILQFCGNHKIQGEALLVHSTCFLDGNPCCWEWRYIFREKGRKKKYAKEFLVVDHLAVSAFVTLTPGSTDAQTSRSPHWNTAGHLGSKSGQPSCGFTCCHTAMDHQVPFLCLLRWIYIYIYKTSKTGLCFSSWDGNAFWRECSKRRNKDKHLFLTCPGWKDPFRASWHPEFQRVACVSIDQLCRTKLCKHNVMHCSLDFHITKRKDTSFEICNAGDSSLGSWQEVDQNNLDIISVCFVAIVLGFHSHTILRSIVAQVHFDWTVFHFREKERKQNDPFCQHLHCK